METAFGSTLLRTAAVHIAPIAKLIISLIHAYDFRADADLDISKEMGR